MSDIFGGSKEKSVQESHNQAYPMLTQALGGTISQGTGAGTQIGNLLGLNGPQGQNSGFNNWRQGTGYQFGLNQGVQSITGNAATQGLLNSGATAKAVNTYGQNYANTQYGDYVNQLQSLLGSGLQGAGIVGSAGNVSTGQSSGSSTKGAGGFLGSLLAK